MSIGSRFRKNSLVIVNVEQSMLWSLLRDSKGIDSRSKANLLAGLSTTKIVRGENLTHVDT